VENVPEFKCLIGIRYFKPLLLGLADGTVEIVWGPIIPIENTPDLIIGIFILKLLCMID